MDVVVDRVGATPQRRHAGLSWFGSPVLRIAATAAVAVAAVMAGAQLGGLFDRDSSTGVSPSGDPTPTPTASPATSSPASIAASAAPSLEPGTGDPGDLLLRLYAVCDTGPGLQPAPAFTLMGDGTVVWLAINHTAAPDGPPLEYFTRRLTPSGLEEMREHIFGSGLFEASAEYRHQRRPGTAEPPGHGACNYRFTAADGAVIVEATNWFGDEEEGMYYEPAPERKALDTLANQLREPEGIVRADAWASDAAPYEGVDYQLVLLPARNMPDLYDDLDASEIPWPFDGPLDEAGERIDWQRPEIGARCLGITRDDAAAIADAILSGGASDVFGLSQPSMATLSWDDGNGTVELSLLPRMPDGYPQCDDET